MPSPIGHALAGAAIAWLSDLPPGHTSRTGKHESRRWNRANADPHLALACAGLATLPDADLLLPIAHRTVTHSVTAVAAVALFMIVATGVTGKVTPRAGLACVTAYASHLLLDWLQADPTPPFGIQLFWPMSSEWFISGWEIFRGTERQHLLEAATIARNAVAVGQEVAILGPVAAAAWLVRIKALSRLATEMARRHHSPE